MIIIIFQNKIQPHSGMETMQSIRIYFEINELKIHQNTAWMQYWMVWRCFYLWWFFCFDNSGVGACWTAYSTAYILGMGMGKFRCKTVHWNEICFFLAMQSVGWLNEWKFASKKKNSDFHERKQHKVSRLGILTRLSLFIIMISFFVFAHQFSTKRFWFWSFFSLLFFSQFTFISVFIFIKTSPPKRIEIFSLFFFFN